MKRKIVGILVVTLLIAIAVLPVVGMRNESKANEKETNSTISNIVVEYELDLIIDLSNPSVTSNLYDPYEIYEGQHLKITITGYWSPPNPGKLICMWVEATTLPAGATFTPECHCDYGEVSSIFEWTPAIGQAGTYIVIFYLGEFCGIPLGTFSITIIVHPATSDDPPLVVIQSPPDGTTFNAPDITLTGYAIDDKGIVSIGSHHEWTGDEAMTSGTIPTTTYYPFSWDFDLYEGWNRITIFVHDTKGQYGEDKITVYYVIATNQPPNQPSKPSGSEKGKAGDSLHYESYFSDPDGDSMEVFFDWGDGTNTGWIGPVASGTIVGNYHTWSSDGTYQVKTKARDIPHNEESIWSDPLSVSMPKNKATNTMPLFLQFLENHPYMFPLLRHLLGL